MYASEPLPPLQTTHGITFVSHGSGDFFANKTARETNLLKGRGAPKGKAPCLGRTEFRDYYCSGKDDRILKPVAERIDARTNDTLSRSLGQLTGQPCTTHKDMYRWPGISSVSGPLVTHGQLSLNDARRTDFWRSTSQQEFVWHGKPKSKRRVPFLRVGR
eukprot:TRINITY_DN96592_c0_g1_i1.p1 TRINITY_DN96592_c0_g1~~TRINITY_DN96592_c0_g1_i1.p1  ORF type:complete len:160 (-),score=8.07 TRINITY_DN96592_c0_g1_i1:12-491(-)